MAIKLDHIGLVFWKISDIAGIFRALGFREMTDPEPDPIQKVAASFVPVGDGQDVYIELLEPAEERSPVTEFLKKKGGGLHHICFEVDDIEEITERLRKRGVKMVCEPVDCVGYDRSFQRRCVHSSKIAFFLLPNKILVEFLQKGR